jgi:hypothetical protein
MIKRNLIKTAILCLITGFTLSGCSKDEPQTEKQTVEFTFGPTYWDEVYPTTNIAKAGADKNVGKIKIKSNGDNFSGLKISDISALTLDPAFAAANGKGTGDGTVLNGVQIDNKADSTKAVAYGYIFSNCYVPGE